MKKQQLAVSTGRKGRCGVGRTTTTDVTSAAIQEDGLRTEGSVGFQDYCNMPRYMWPTKSSFLKCANKSKAAGLRRTGMKQAPSSTYPTKVSVAGAKKEDKLLKFVAEVETPRGLPKERVRDSVVVKAPVNINLDENSAIETEYTSNENKENLASLSTTTKTTAGSEKSEYDTEIQAEWKFNHEAAMHRSLEPIILTETASCENEQYGDKTLDDLSESVFDDSVYFTPQVPTERVPATPWTVLCDKLSNLELKED